MREIKSNLNMKNKVDFLINNIQRLKVVVPYLKVATPYLIRIYVLMTFVMNILKTLGCIGYRTYAMQDSFFACSLYIILMCLYEYQGIQETEKVFLMGIIMGNIASVYDERFFYLLILFVVNIIWTQIAEGRSCWRVLRKIIEMIFFCMCTLEVHSICTVMNDLLLVTREYTSFLFNFVDAFFVFSAIAFFACNRENDINFLIESQMEIKEKKFYAHITKMAMWILLVFVVLIVVASTMYINGKNSIEEFCFFFGKVIDRGYLICVDSEKTWLYFVERYVEGLGGVLENAELYNFVELGNGFSMQKLLLYVGAFVAKCLYGYGTVLVMVIGGMAYFAYKIYKINLQEI